jgi:metal-responsive CopG/Arc/MetJ family transcriptional regulator
MKIVSPGMKKKISITVSAELLEELDLRAGLKQSRSAFIERVLRSYFR